MKKEFRIKKSDEILRVLNNKKYKSNKYFTVYILKNEETKSFRYALSVGEKIGNAVLRNKVKRQLREIIRNNIDITKEMDLLILARPACANLTYAKKEFELLFLFKKLNINKEKISAKL